MKSCLYLIILLPLIATIAGCAGKVQTDVVSFHENNLPRGETIRIEPMDATKQGSLEFNHYADIFRKKLSAIGYSPVASGQTAQLIARVDYSISDGMTEVRSLQDRHSRYHFYYGHFYDPFYYGLYDHREPETYSYIVYNRTLRMNIVTSGDDGKVIFEGRVQSVGREKEIAKVMPYMVTAMFNNYPGESGVTKVISIQRNGDSRQE